MDTLVSLHICKRESLSATLFVSRCFFNGSVAQTRGFKNIVKAVYFVPVAKCGGLERYSKSMYAKPCEKAFCVLALCCV